MIIYLFIRKTIILSLLFYIKTYLINYHPNIKRHLDKYSLYMDNAKIHIAKVTQTFRSKFNIIYGPPYTPFFNIIEYVFGYWKRLLI